MDREELESLEQHCPPEICVYCNQPIEDKDMKRGWFTSTIIPLSLEKVYLHKECGDLAESLREDSP